MIFDRIFYLFSSKFDFHLDKEGEKIKYYTGALQAFPVELFVMRNPHCRKVVEKRYNVFSLNNFQYILLKINIYTLYLFLRNNNFRIFQNSEIFRVEMTEFRLKK